MLFMLFVLRADERRVRDFAFCKDFIRALKAIFGFYAEFLNRLFSRLGVYVGNGGKFGSFIGFDIPAEKLPAAPESYYYDSDFIHF